MYALEFPFTKEPFKKRVCPKKCFRKNVGQNRHRLCTDRTDYSVIWDQGFGFEAVTY